MKFMDGDVKTPHFLKQYLHDVCSQWQLQPCSELSSVFICEDKVLLFQSCLV